MTIPNESAWVQYVRKHFEPIDDTYEQEMLLLSLLNAPEEYAVEDEMLTYANAHPNATMNELFDYFREIA